MLYQYVKTASFLCENWRFWSGLRDLNPRSLGPKPSAIPNFAKPGYEVKNFSDVVKHVVKGYFRPEQGRSQEEKILESQRVFGLVDFTGANRAPAPKPGALPTGPHPDMKLREFSQRWWVSANGLFNAEYIIHHLGRNCKTKMLFHERIDPQLRGRYVREWARARRRCSVQITTKAQGRCRWR